MFYDLKSNFSAKDEGLGACAQTRVRRRIETAAMGGSKLEIFITQRIFVGRPYTTLFNRSEGKNVKLSWVPPKNERILKDNGS